MALARVPPPLAESASAVPAASPRSQGTEIQLYNFTSRDTISTTAPLLQGAPYQRAFVSPLQLEMVDSQRIVNCNSDEWTDATSGFADEITFEPAVPLGIFADWGSGIVTEVEQHGQAHEKGVKVRWMMYEIDGNPYSEELLDEKMKGTLPYDICFKEGIEEEGCLSHEYKNCCIFCCFCKGLWMEKLCGRKVLMQDMAASSEEGYFDRCISTCLFWCGCGTTDAYFALSAEGGQLNRDPLYGSLPARRDISCLTNFFLLPIHLHRSSAMNRLNRYDMVSEEERHYLQDAGRLKHPLIQQRVAAPILNFIVWRRSSLVVIMALTLILIAVSVFNIISGEGYTERHREMAKQNLVTYAQWSEKPGNDGEPGGFPRYMKFSMRFMMEKLISETVWVRYVKRCIRAGFKVLMVIPLLFANLSWMRWRQSAHFLTIVWLMAFALPFVTNTVPTRLLIDFDSLIQGDVEILKTEATTHYNLDGHLENVLSNATKACNKNDLENIQSFVDLTSWSHTKAHQHLLQMCIYTQQLDNSFVLKSLTGLHNEAHTAHMKCQQSQEKMLEASSKTGKKVKEINEKLQEAKVAYAQVCETLGDMVTVLRPRDSALSMKQRQLHDLAATFVQDGCSGLTEVLNTVVGMILGLGSFKSLWTAALSLGPGMIKGTMRAKTIIPEASLPGAFIVILPWIYAPLAWALFNIIVQIFGSWALLGAMLSLTFYPIVISLVGLSFFVGSPQRPGELTDLMRIFKRIEVMAVIVTLILVGLWAYLAVARVNEAQENHPLLKASLDFLLAQSRKMSGFVKERMKKFDIIQWVIEHPRVATQGILASLAPMLSFLHKFLITSIMSTDWMLIRVANERHHEYMDSNKHRLPYFTTSEEMERLGTRRRIRLDALAVALGGQVEDAHQAREARRKRARK